MIFCGQCGLMIVPGSTTCPRCGAKLDPDLRPTEPYGEDATHAFLPHVDAPTPYPEVPQQSFGTPSPQQKLILGSDNYWQQENVNEQTGMMDAPMIGYSQSPATRIGAVPQYDNIYATEAMSPAEAMRPQRMEYQSAPTQYANPVSDHYGAGNMDSFHPAPPVRHKRGSHVGLILFVLVLLVILLGAVILFARPTLLATLLHQNTGTGTTPAATSTTTTLSPAEQATNLLQQYYSDINQKNYQDAYNLWGTAYQNTHPLSDFTNGYAHTLHDDVTINRTTVFPDKSVQVFITIRATENRAAGQVVSTYSGIYRVGQENGQWKILRGSFKKVA